MRTLRATSLALLLALLLAVPAFAGGDGGDASLTISVSCETDPETVTVTNNLGGTLNVVTIGSLDDPRSDEPFFLPDSGLEFEVPAGDSIMYEAGEAADENVLIDNFIFDNDAEDEGVEVSIGPEGITGQNGPLEFEVLCSEGTETFTFDDDGETPEMPDTGAGGMAGSGLPVGNAAVGLGLVVALGYSVLRRR